MRIFFEIDAEYKLYDEINAKEIQFFIYNFPCRVNISDFDCFRPKDLIPIEFHKNFNGEIEFFDDFDVSCTRFDKDEYGFFQHVWLI